jgi:hypothetical protein
MRTEAARFKIGDRENWSAVLASRKIGHGERPTLGRVEKRLGTEHSPTRPRKRASACACLTDDLADRSMRDMPPNKKSKPETSGARPNRTLSAKPKIQS